ncbi:hypothetical protein YC2023_108950 [Brassica napus]
MAELKSTKFVGVNRSLPEWWGAGLRIVEAVALEHNLSSSMSCGEETRPGPQFVGEEETMCVDHPSRPSAMEKRLEGGELLLVKYFIVKFVTVAGILDIIVHGYKVDIENNEVMASNLDLSLERRLLRSLRRRSSSSMSSNQSGELCARSSNGEANVGKVVIARDEVVAGDDVVSGDEVVVGERESKFSSLSSSSLRPDSLVLEKDESSNRRLRTQHVSATVFPTPMYSASALDLETVCWRFENHKMRLWPR